jgi:hypothetical protein
LNGNNGHTGGMDGHTGEHIGWSMWRNRHIVEEHIYGGYGRNDGQVTVLGCIWQLVSGREKTLFLGHF